MGQVPAPTKSRPSYAFLGSGRLAKHLHHYFKQLGIPFVSWSRNGDPAFNTFSGAHALRRTLDAASHWVILIKDDAIADFVQNLGPAHGKTLIHCSGSLVLDGVSSAHPLMTFTNDLYDIDTYQSIPFITEKGKHSLHQLFPNLPNEGLSLEPEKKALYHSYCVISGNFTALLWQHVFSDFASQLELPGRTLQPYMLQVFRNLLYGPETAASGPLVRGDMKTIAQNLGAIADTPWEDIYKGFLKLRNLPVPLTGEPQVALPKKRLTAENY